MPIWKRLGFFVFGLSVAWVGFRLFARPEVPSLPPAPRDVAVPGVVETRSHVVDDASAEELRHAFDSESGAPRLWALMRWLEKEGRVAFAHACASMEPKRVLSLWAVVDPDATLAFVRTASDRTWQYEVVPIIGRAFPERRDALAEAFPRMRNSLSSLEPDSPVRHFLRDPNGFTLEEIRQNPRESARALVKRLDGSGLTEAVNEFAWRRRSAQKDNALPDVFLLELLEKGGEALAPLMSKVYNKARFSWSLNDIAERVASEDPEGMKYYLKNFNPSLIRPELIRAFLRGWARTEGPAAFEWAERHLPNYIAEPFATWAEQEPETAARYAVSIEEPVQQRQAATQVAKTWSASRPEAALSWILEQSDEMRPELLRSAFANLVAHDPSWAAQWAGELLLAQNDGVFGRPTASFDLLLEKWAESDPAEAAAWARDFEGLNSLQTGLGALARKWFQQDETAVIDWINTLPGGPARTDALLGLVEGMVEDRPQREFDTAFQWITQMEPGDEQAGALHLVLLPWLTHDATAVADALEATTFPPDVIDGSLKFAVRSWAFEDFESARIWIGGLERGEVKDSAIQGLIDALIDTPTFWSSRANVDPVLAREWAEQISDPGQRAERISQLDQKLSNGEE